MSYILEQLNNPNSVAWVQYHLGVRWSHSQPDNKIYPQNERHLLEKDVKISNKPFYWFVRASSELAGEPFYHIFYPACAWIFEMHFARRNIMMLSLMMFVGQSLKDILKYPRPISPPVIRLEAAYATEYGMPSTHTVLGVTVPFSFLYLLSYTQEVPQCWYIGAALWSSCVVFSRIYLGMHSFLQVICGAAIPSCLLTLVSPLIIYFDQLQLEADESFTAVTILSLFFLSGSIFYLDRTIDPKTSQIRWTTSRGDTAEILGWCAGFLFGTRWVYLNPVPSLNNSVFLDNLSSNNTCLHLLFRFITGALVLGPGTLVVRKFWCHLFIVLNGLSNMELYKSKKVRTVEWPYKFLSVFTSAVFATCVIPKVYHLIGLW